MVKVFSVCFGKANNPAHLSGALLDRAGIKGK